MRWALAYGALLVAILIVASLTQTPPDDAPSVTPTPTLSTRMTLVTDYRQRFVHYATVDRPDARTRRLWINPEALEGLQPGQPLPQGTLLIIEAFEVPSNVLGQPQVGPDGQLVRGDLIPSLHIAEKRPDWTFDDLHAASRLGDWNFGAFEPETGAFQPEGLNDCFSCHEGASGLDFIFSRPLIDRYLQTQRVSHRRCSRPGRLACALR